MSSVRKGMLRFGTALLCGGLLCSGSASAQTVQRAVEDAFWDSVKGCTSAGEVKAYLKEFPKGRYVGAARACLARLRDDSRPSRPVFRDCPECPEMVVVQAGKFTMGSPKGEKGRESDEGPQRRVTIRRPFAVGRYEVTRGEWHACQTAGVCRRRVGGAGQERHPVTSVNWLDAKTYVIWLSRRTGKRYRLLSEAEWEYAARAGTTTRYHWGDAIGRNRANCKECGSQWDGKKIAPVGSFLPNGFGLHDMHGNVYEWVEDCWRTNYNGAPSDGRARTKSGNCARRVLRSGSWSSESRYLRAANRNHEPDEKNFNNVGFRVARTLSP